MLIPRELDGSRGRTVFEAVHRRREATIYWHLDDRYLGETHTFHQQSLDIDPGEHILTLVDDEGERVARRFQVLATPTSHDEAAVFDGFTLTHVETDEVTIRLRHGGSGPPLLLLHGFPQTHAMWSKVAPRLAEHYTVVCPDLRGYGGSSKPESSANHETYSKRAMARDQIEVMKKLGFEKFHRRGSRPRRTLRVSPGARFTGSRSANSRCSTSCPPATRCAAPTGNSAWATGTGSSSRRRIRCPSA